MNTQRLILGCLVLLLPGTAQAALDGLPVTATILPLLTVLAVSIAAGWLWRQRQRSDREKQRAIAQLQLLRQVVEQVPVPIVVTDSTLHIVEANASALTTYGHDPLIGCHLLELEPSLSDHPVLAALHPTADRTVATSPLPPFQGTLQSIRVDGQSFVLRCGSVLSNDQQQAAATETMLSLAEESANRMKSEFIANINHEVRTPMNAIIGYTEMLANAELGSKEKRFVAIIHKSSMALVSIFNDIMELSKIDSGRLQIMVSSIRLSSVINEVNGLFQDLAREKGINLHCRIANHLPVTYILDGVRLKQVLQNLVSNAIKFTTEGQVELTVEGTPSSSKPGCYDLQFIIQDTGIGIPMADQQKIFELFRQREDSIAKQYGGVGLGLTLCSRLVTMMGGRIDLFSREGAGARFTVCLGGIPVAEQNGNEPQSVVVPAQGNQQGTTILVVDDVDLIKDVFTDFFQDSPYRVITANNADEALPLVLSERPGLIFMDLNLNGTDGRTVTEQIRQYPEAAAIPVIVMTGEMLEEDEYKPLFDDFLQKPFRLDALKEIVARYTASVRNAASQAEACDSIDEEERTLSACLAAAWTDDLNQFLRQAQRSGSLADAAELAHAMRQQGEKERQPVLTGLGEDLLHFATEPNILGVDRLLAKLSRGIDRKEP